MSSRSGKLPSFASLSFDQTLVSPSKISNWETRIPSPKKENTCATSPRNHISILPDYVGPLTFSPSKVLPALPKTPKRTIQPLNSGTNGRTGKKRLEAQVDHSTDLSDKARWPRPVYKRADLIAAEAHELIDDMGMALQIIIKNSPPKAYDPAKVPHGQPLDDSSFACEFGIEQYREGFGRRAMQSEPSPMKQAVDELKKELKDELRVEIKKELKAEIEVELKQEIKGEIYVELADELTKEHMELQQMIEDEDAKTVKDGEPASIQDTVRGLRDDLSVSDVAEDEEEVEEPIDPTDPALAFFLNWRAPKRDSGETARSEKRSWGSSSGSCYSQ